LPLDCADEAIEYPTIATHGLPILARLSAVWILRKITERLRLPFAVARSSNGTLLTPDGNTLSKHNEGSYLACELDAQR
jgi:hypothetical protein